MGTYANHPPLIYWSIAATESVLGERPWATRLPTILAALATIPLLFSVIRRAGIMPLPAAAGVAVAVSNPLFSIYGWIPDTPMLALPLGLATLLAWQRSRDDRPIRRSRRARLPHLPRRMAGRLPVPDAGRGRGARRPAHGSVARR